uniref:RLR CTR domain-containing protein n=1 Tax=Strongyloides papillosus TaxID=174720 RepID=A0A0N5B7U6_STREA
MAFEEDNTLDLDNLPIVHFLTYKYEIIEYFMMPKAEQWLTRIISKIKTKEQASKITTICSQGRYQICKLYYEEFKPYLDKHFIIAALNEFPHEIRERALLENLPPFGLELYSQFFSKRYDDRLFEKLFYITNWYDVFEKFNSIVKYKTFCQRVKREVKRYPGVPEFLGCVFLRELPYISHFKSIDKNWFYDFRAACAESEANRAIVMMYFPDFVPFLKSRKLKQENDEKERKKSLGKNMVPDDTDVPEIPSVPRHQSDYMNYLTEISRKSLGSIQPLKSYQQELVSAVDDDIDNHILWVPEQIGKMSIVSHIAKNHYQLLVKQQQLTRILYLVPHFKFVRDYTNYLRSLCSDLLNIDGIADCEWKFDNVGRVMAHDLIIMSGQMFLDLLKVKNVDFRLYFQDFSLIFIDGCEMCLESHSYNAIVNLLKENKYEKPKIIGLTETLGKHVSNNEDCSMESLADLCLSLNCFKIDIIKRSVGDFYRDIPKGFQEIVFCLSPPNFLHHLIIRESYTVEKAIVEVMGKFDPDNVLLQSVFPGIDEGGYENFCNNLIQSIQDKPEGPIKRGIIAAVDYLVILAVTLSLDTVIPTEYSLDSCLYKLKRWNDKCEDESTLTRKVLESYNRVINSKDDSKFKALESEKKYPLTRLENIIRKVLDKNSKEKILIRVGNGALALNLFRWLSNTDILKDYNITHSYIVGTNRQNSVDVNMDTYRADKISKFFDGLINILITTDVCQDDIDISYVDCFISYNCSVTYSKCTGNFKKSGPFPKTMALIVSEGLLELDDQRKFEKDRMTNCIAERIRKMSDQEFRNYIEDREQIIQTRNKNFEIAKKEISFRNEGKVYDISCCSCMSYICSSNDIGIFDNISNIIINSDVWSNLIYSTDRHYKYGRTFMRVGLVYCKKCKSNIPDNSDENYALGSIIKLRQGFVVKLTVRNVIFTDVSTKENTYKKSWSSIENYLFLPKQVTEEEYRIYCYESMCYDPDMHLKFMKKMSFYMGACRSSIFYKEK